MLQKVFQSDVFTLWLIYICFSSTFFVVVKHGEELKVSRFFLNFFIVPINNSFGVDRLNSSDSLWSHFYLVMALMADGQSPSVHISPIFGKTSLFHKVYGIRVIFHKTKHHFLAGSADDWWVMMNYDNWRRWPIKTGHLQAQEQVI